MLYNLRNWLLRLLAGKAEVVLNATIEGTLRMQGSHGLIVGTKLDPYKGGACLEVSGNHLYCAGARLQSDPAPSQ